MIERPLDQIQYSDLRNLIVGKVAERKTMEYKRDLPGGTDSEKKEFLADISSFANTIGGDLIYGIEEKAGLPKSIKGVQLTDPDKEIHRLESIIRAGIAPRLMGFETRVIPKNTRRSVLVIRIRRSLNAPHRVVFGGHDKFYGRSSAGKYPLDVDELRTAFVSGETFARRVRDFRAERIAMIQSGMTPVPIAHGPKVILHLIPLSAFYTGQRVAIERYYNDPRSLLPIGSGANYHGPNLDGTVTSTDVRQSTAAEGYTQLFRTGAIEALRVIPVADQVVIFLPERPILERLPAYLDVMKTLGLGPPVYVFLTLLDVGHLILTSGYGSVSAEPGVPPNRDLIDVPEVVIEDLTARPEAILRPLFDIAWNAWGFTGSPNFDGQGNWIGRQY